MSHVAAAAAGAPHLTWLESAVIGLLQGVSELFPVSSLGHSVLVPALVGGRWARDLNVSTPESPYLAFVVGLHVATALEDVVAHIVPTVVPGVVVPTPSRDAVATPGSQHRCPHCRQPLAIISVVIPADAAVISVPEPPMTPS